ncbi:MAG: hypothetical protein PHW34_11635 [Hespellia sp.]|nr:hypothetical protein [Hespellia sp.]
MKEISHKIELIFDSLYLFAAFMIGLYLLLHAGEDQSRILAGTMALVLVGGDAFHLMPRIFQLKNLLGRGKQITSITMTVFYFLLWQIGQTLYEDPSSQILTIIIYILGAVRIILCLLPQNRWTSEQPPVQYGILRNIPFFVMGLVIAGWYFIHSGVVGSLSLMWLAILISFACYMPVVLWAHKKPVLGILMLPKTCAYIWMLTMCLGL